MEPRIHLMIMAHIYSYQSSPGVIIRGTVYILKLRFETLGKIPGRFVVMSESPVKNSDVSLNK